MTILLATLFGWALNMGSVAAHSPSNNEEDLFRLGTVHYQRGEWEFAIKRFAELLEKTEQKKLKSLSQFYLAESLVAAKQYTRAKKQLLEFIQSNLGHQFHAQAVFRLGEVSFLLGDQEQAFTSLSMFAKDHSDHPLSEYALPYLGELEIKKGNLTSASQYFQSSLKNFPNGKLANESRFGLARVLEKTDSDNEAIRFYRYLVERPDSNRAADSLLQLGKIYFRQNNYGQCTAALTRFQKEYSDHHLAHPVCYWMGRNLYEQKEFKLAEAQFGKALNDNPKEKIVPALKFELARCLIEQRRFADGIAHLKQVVEKFPESEWADDALLLNIQVLRNNQQYQLARRLCDSFHRSYAQSELASYVLESDAECRFELQDFVSAEYLYRTLVEKGSQSPVKGDVEAQLTTWQYKLAVCQLKQSRDREAFSTLQSINIEKCNDETQSAVVLALATIQIERKQFTAATKNLIAFVDANPNSAAAQKCVVDVTLLYGKRGNLQNAEEWLSRLTGESYVQTAVQLADIAYSSKQYSYAENWYALVVGKAKDKELKCRGMMGSVWSLKELGNVESTIAAAERLVQSFPESKQAHEALYLTAVLSQKSGRTLNALAAFENLVRHYPASKHVSQSLLSMSGLYRKHKPNQISKLIVPLSQQIANSKENNDQHLYELAWILKDCGQTQKSIDCFERLQEEYPASRFAGEAVMQIAEHKLNSNDKKSAVELLNKLSQGEIDPKWGPNLYYQLGKQAYEAKDFANAYKHMQSVSLKYPSHSITPAANYWAAEAKYRSGDIVYAAKLFESLVNEIDKQSGFYVKALLRLAQLHIKLKQWNAAIDGADLLKKLNKADLNHEADFVLGRANIGLGLFTKSRAAFDRVLKSPQSKGTETAAMSQWLIGETYFHQEEFDLAIDAYQKTEILHAYPEWQAASLLQAGKCFERKNDMANAMKNYERVVAKYSNFEYANEARTRLTEIKELTQTTNIRRQKTYSQN